MGRDALTIGPDYLPFIRWVEAQGYEWERGILWGLYGVIVNKKLDKERR